ncbi:MAG TPA: hydrogenase expression/formation C-terminal domain-containing protein [Burkholderiales bacterium]|nr:hydrogenase expression/formation C-terminal domain-containing protein [Burkholderiales bacterium]
MNAIDRIGVKVIAAADIPTGNVKPLLFELAGLLEAWLSKGESASIDLRSLPLTRGDYAELEAALGSGAVSASVEAIGASEVRETRYPGVWRVTHRNEAGEVAADLLEVCGLPEILRAPAEDAADGLIRLKEALQP